MLRYRLFSLHSCNGAVSGSRNNLTQCLYADISSGKYTRDIGVHVVVGLDLSVVHIKHSLEELASGIVADEAEQAE